VNWQKLHRSAERDRAGKGFARSEWIDESPRFPNFRQDELGNTGYCLMALGPDGVTLTYKDWQGHKQHPPFFFPIGVSGRAMVARAAAKRARQQPTVDDDE
jgi:hypothetical protein